MTHRGPTRTDDAAPPVRFIIRRRVESVAAATIDGIHVAAHVVVLERWSDGIVTDRIMGAAERRAWLKAGGR